MTYTVQFRGHTVEVEVTKDGGYEPDTNAHDIEWKFFDMNPVFAQFLNGLELTDDDEQSIYEQIYRSRYL